MQWERPRNFKSDNHSINELWLCSCLKRMNLFSFPKTLEWHKTFFLGKYKQLQKKCIILFPQLFMLYHQNFLAVCIVYTLIFILHKSVHIYTPGGSGSDAFGWQLRGGNFSLHLNDRTYSGAKPPLKWWTHLECRASHPISCAENMCESLHSHPL